MKRAKQCLSLCLSLVLVLSILGSVPAEASFRDVSSADWYYNAVNFAVDKGLFQGTSSSTFSPNEAMTRGMFVTVLGRVAGLDASQFSGSDFSDVSASAYYAPYIKWATGAGIAKGTGNGKFSPDQSISRQDLVTLLRRYVTAIDGNDFDKNPSAITRFSDWSSIPSYALSPMSWAVGQGFVNGSNGRLNGAQSATRAEVAQIVMKAYDTLTTGTIDITSNAPGETPATEFKGGDFACYTDANGLTYAEDKRPLLNLRADKSFTVLMNDGNTMHSGSGTWRIFVSDGGERYLLIDITSLESWPEQDDYAFYIAKNGTLLKCDGSLGITPVDSVFEPIRASDENTEPLPEEPLPEESGEPKPEASEGEDEEGGNSTICGTPAPNDPGGKTTIELIPTTREGLDDCITGGVTGGGEPTTKPNNLTGARTHIIEWLEAPVLSFTSSTLVFKGSWTTAYYYYPSYQAAQNAIARAEFGVSSLSALTAKQLASVNASADFIASGKLVGSKSTGSVSFGSMRSGNELLLYTGNIVLDEGPYVNSGNPLVGSWRIAAYMKTGLDSTQFYPGSSIPELYYDSEQCALIGNTSTDYASGAARDVSFVLFFDLNSAGELIAEGLAVCTDDMGLHLYQRLSLKIDMDASFI